MPCPHSLRWRWMALLGIALLGAACGGSGGPDATPPIPPPPPQPPPPVGTATVLAQSCTGGAGSLAPNACWRLRVEGEGNPPVEVEVRLYEPAGPLRGMVVCSAGGTGADFYGGLTGGEELFQALLAAGWRVVDHAWQGGWFSSSGDIRTQSARYATLLTWVHDTLHTTGELAAVGNSGGAAAIAYALTSWGRAPLLDIAVLTSGPPLTRLDWLCEDPPSATWASQCVALVPTGALTCGFARCGPEPNNPVCPLLPPNPVPGELQEQSILHSAAVLSYPTTRVQALFGSEDCTSAVPLGLFFVMAVTSTVDFAFVPGAPHLLSAVPRGRDAIVQALEPQGPFFLLRAAGGAGELDVVGPPGEPYAVLATAAPSGHQGPLPEEASLGAAPVVLAAGTLDPVQGLAHVVVEMPAGVAAEARGLLVQARVGTRLTNVVRSTAR